MKHEETETLWAVKKTSEEGKPIFVKFFGKTILYLKRCDAIAEAKARGCDAKAVKVRMTITEL